MELAEEELSPTLLKAPNDTTLAVGIEREGLAAAVVGFGPMCRAEEDDADGYMTVKAGKVSTMRVES